MKSPNHKHKPKHTSKPRWTKGRVRMDCFYVLLVRYIKCGKKVITYSPYLDKFIKSGDKWTRELSRNDVVCGSKEEWFKI